MAEERNVFTDPGAFGGATPQPVSLPDPTPQFEGLFRLAGAFANLGETYAKADEADKVLRAQLLIGERFAELEFDVQKTTDLKEAQKLFDNGSTEIREESKILAGGVESTQQRIDASYRSTSLKVSANVKKNLFDRKITAHSANRLKLRNQLLSSSLNNPDPEMTDEKEEWRAALESDVDAGYMFEESVDEEVAKFTAELSYNRAAVLVASDPTSAYTALTEADESGDPVNFKGMTGNQRRSLFVSSLSQLANNESKAAKAAKVAQAQAAIGMWSKVAKDELTLDELLANSGSLAKSDFVSLIGKVTAPEPDQTPRDDPLVLNAMLQRLYDPNAVRSEVRNDLIQANFTGALTGSTASGLLAKNQEFINADDSTAGGPGTPFDIGFRYLRTSMRADSIIAAGDIGENKRLAKAQIEFQQFGVKNPNATITEFEDFADKVYERWSLVNLNDKSITWDIPWGVPGPRSKYTTEGIKKAATLLESQKGTMAPDDMARNRANLKRWYNAVRQKEREQREREAARGRR